MGRKKNPLFTHKDNLNVEGRTIKHIGLIKNFGTVNINSKTSQKRMRFVGLDLETNHKTAELKLLGIWDGTDYRYYTDNFINHLYKLLKYCDFKNLNLVYWNKLDPFVIFKQFLLYLSPEAQKRALSRYGKVSGVWNRKQNAWSVSPLCELRINDSNISFGIKNVIRSSILFYIRKDGQPLNEIWAYDIAQLYHYGLEREMTDRAKQFPYYSKVSQESHLVDWARFETDKNYRENEVLLSNQFDARAVYDLANNIQDLFYKVFKCYPTKLISTGGLARASIVAVTRNEYTRQGLSPKDVESNTLEDVQSISIFNHTDKWAEQIGKKEIIDFLCMTTEAYSGGYIDAITYGKIPEAHYSDIASAYPSIIKKLWDLRDSVITYGEGEPPHLKNSYCLIRGMVHIPENVDFHPLTVKHPENLDTNVRAVGEYRASYTLGERDDLIKLGATFSDEKWYNVKTTGKMSPISKVVSKFIDLRNELKKKKDSAEYMAKITINSSYGILFEATDLYDENDTFETERIGYRGGEFLNTLYATIITSEVRRLIASACNDIVANGGDVHLIMTDAIVYSGGADKLPKKYIRDVKTLGYFETPVKISNLALLGTGRYTYTDDGDGYVTTKNRGLNVTAIHDENGMELDAHDWNYALELAERQNTLKIRVKTRLLVSVGMVNNVNEITDYDANGNEIKIPITINDLGLVMEVNKKVDLITGMSKRIPNISPTVYDVSRGHIKTHSIYLYTGMFGDGEIVDQTLPFHREETMKKTYKTSKVRNLENRSKASIKYAKKHADEINGTARAKYQMLKALGYSRDECKRISKWGYQTIQDFLMANQSINDFVKAKNGA